MTPKELQAIADGTKAYVAAEIRRLETPIIDQGEDIEYIRQRMDALVRKLVQVTTALVTADEALAERLGLIEDELWPTPDHFEGNLGANIAGGYEPRPKRRRFFRAS